MCSLLMDMAFDQRVEPVYVHWLCWLEIILEKCRNGVLVKQDFVRLGLTALQGRVGIDNIGSIKIDDRKKIGTSKSNK